MTLSHLSKPIAVALKGKGPASLLKRIWTIKQRYGLTAAKMDRSLKQLAHLLHEFDCQGTFPITTVALARNGAVIQKYQAQGIEFAVHGYRHIDHSQLSKEEQTAHFQKASRVFHEQDIHCNGFRCPYLRWNEDTLSALSEINFSYDSSNSLVWEVDKKHKTDSYNRALKFYGAQSAKDYLAVPNLDPEKNLVQIPYCLPDDESLVERLQWHSSAEMATIWPAMFQEIHKQGELFNLGLHPERTADCANGLQTTMEAIQAVASEVWRARLSDIADWWKARYEAKMTITEPQTGALQLAVHGPPGTTLLLRNLEVKTKTEPWFDGYRVADELLCYIQATKRPFIGASPQSNPMMLSFLKQQGYIIETTSDPASHTFYLDRKTFSKEEERALITQIETGTFPLARLGRWPNKARSAFCVTGDIDALTIWDYGLRFAGH